MLRVKYRRPMLKTGTSLSAHRYALTALAVLGGIALCSPVARAQDLFLTSDATTANGNPVNATFDNVYVGLDSLFNTIGNVKADIVTNAKIKNQLGAYGNSSIKITAGTIDNIFIDDSSFLLVNGGTIGYAVISGTGTISGGNFTDTLNTVEANGNAAVTINGGKFTTGFVARDNSTITVTGSNLSTTLLSTQGNYNASDFNNYIVNSYQLTGKLSSNAAINTTIFSAGSVSGSTTSLTFKGDGSTLAPQLNVTANSTTAGIYNDIIVGISADGNTSTSPKVSIGSDTDTARVWAYNGSKVDINGGLIHDSVFAEDTSTVTLNSGGADYIQGDFNSNIIVNGGSVANVTAFNNTAVTVTDGNVDHVDAYDNSHVTVTNGLFTNISAYGSSTIDFTGGNTNFLYTTDSAVANVSGGNLADVIGQGGIVNISGGIISNNTLYNLGQTTFNLLGSFALPASGQVGIYDDGTTIWNGVYWDLSGTLNNSDILDTRYFEAGGSLSGPNYRIDGTGLHLFGVAPEPGTIALLLIGGVPFIALMYRRMSLSA